MGKQFTLQVTITSPQDIGRLTVAILFTQPEITDEVVYVAGDTLSYGDIADVVEKAWEEPIKRVKWTVPHLQESLKEKPDDAMRKYRVAFALGRGTAWDMNTTFNAAHDIPVTNLRQWIDQNMA